MKGLTLLWEKYDDGCPNVFMCGDFNLKEVDIIKAIRQWRKQFPKCPYTPVYTRGEDATGNELFEKDFIIFFAETGADLG